MAERIKLPENTRVIKDDTGYAVYYKSTYLHHDTNKLEAYRWGREHATTTVMYRYFFCIPPHEWNGVQQL